MALYMGNYWIIHWDDRPRNGKGCETLKPSYRNGLFHLKIFFPIHLFMDIAMGWTLHWEGR